MADRDIAVSVNQLSRDYGDTPVLRDISFTLEEGKTLVVFGANGAGKTTLLHILATLLRPHGGTVNIFGHKLADDAFAVRREVGLLTHNPLLYRDLTARENLRFQAKLHAIDEQRVEELLAQAKMTKRADEPVYTLSRGMQQRIAICRTVLHNPRLLLLDEPYSNLDPSGVAAVEGLIGKETGHTRVIVSHSVAEGWTEADHVIGLREGRVVLDNATNGASPSLQSVY
jgi:heme exporter protein A